MGYETFLRFTLVPTALLFSLSLASIVITAHYWILGDWIMGRWVQIPIEYDSQRNRWITDDTIVEYSSSSTDATIVSGCLSLGASIVAFLGWYKLRRADMDADLNGPRRRFWTGFVMLGGTTGFAAALAALIVHYTDRGDDQYGCTSETHAMSSGSNTNMVCSREAGACNFMPQWLSGTSKQWSYELACNEIVAVKWMQIPLMLIAVLIMVMFGMQSWLRKRTRHTRATKEAAVDPEVS
ncbi:hypothetical protein BS50DRAFT_612287 [Corynespora cassiicola Philippines]|uniref:Uncharacterized protein n=1 Tax=Corynespora cassiicola Philippines TaxID=1448308 RepID=A0A2T2NGF6_CORCC|nr:hypothetical protein BS50DRAFT_612287 [Corynespora cassiicola Philippines]